MIKLIGLLIPCFAWGSLQVMDKPSTGSSSVALSSLTDATGTDTLANGANAQVWNWDTVGSATALTMATTHTSFTGKMLTLSSTGNNAGSTGTLLNITSTGNTNQANGISINTTNAAAGSSALSITSATTSSSGHAVLVTGSGTSGNTQLVDITSASTSGSSHDIFRVENSSANIQGTFAHVVSTSTGGSNGVRADMNGTTGSQIAGQFNNASSDVSAFSLVLNNSSASGTGTTLRSSNAQSGGINVDLISSGSTGTKDIIKIGNTSTATTNNGAEMIFYNNRTTGGATTVTAIEGRITDIGNAQYKGVLIFKTANNAAPTEHMRIDHVGHLIYTTTAATVATCGTSPGAVSGNDIAGRVTIGTSASGACTITFANAYTTAPHCDVKDETTASPNLKVAPTTTTAVVSGLGADSDVISWHCVGW